MENIGYYLCIIALIIIGVKAIKAITSCLFRIVIGIAVVGISLYLLSQIGR
ncbi:hypothetical protein [Prevotella ihumii]|uniref:hypothetical protein n=1 Tax=Prevotella ihumii TaxID=1917878 RepID=UPI00192A66DD|nr:hypothetical protein [Prevotella ihumii]